MRLREKNKQFTRDEAKRKSKKIKKRMKTRIGTWKLKEKSFQRI